MRVISVIINNSSSPNKQYHDRDDVQISDLNQHRFFYDFNSPFFPQFQLIYISKHFYVPQKHSTKHRSFNSLLVVCRNVVKQSFMLHVLRQGEQKKAQYQSDINQQVRYQDKESLCGYKCLCCNESGNVKVTGYLLPD